MPQAHSQRFDILQSLFFDEADHKSGNTLVSTDCVSCCPHCHKRLAALGYVPDGAVYLAYCLPCRYLILVENILVCGNMVDAKMDIGYSKLITAFLTFAEGICPPPIIPPC